MAVEATKLNYFPQQLVYNRDLFSPCYLDDNMTNGVAIGANYKADQMRFHGIPTFVGIPNYQTLVCDLQPKTESMNNSNNNPRKRCRDALDDYVSSQIQQHQFETHTIISQHSKRLRLELQEKQTQQAKLLLWAIGQKVMEKDAEIQRMCKLNRMLEERMKSLYIENQLWRDVAQSNEATANSLRTDLEQLLLHEEARLNSATVAEEDVGSCCGSSDDVAADNWGKCGRCGDKDTCVLVLPCRHLCLCEVCGSDEMRNQHEQACPVCNTNIKATLHINMSS